MEGNQPIVHCKRDAFDVYIGRAPGPRGRWGNPYSHRPGTRARFRVANVEEAIEAYRLYLGRQLASGAVKVEDLAELDGKVLGCWCAPGRCHGEVLVRAAAWASSEIRSRQSGSAS